MAAECSCGMPLARREPYCPRCLESNADAAEVELMDLMGERARAALSAG